MLRKATFLAFALVLALSATAFAQSECIVGVYADEAGTQSSLQPVRDLGNPLVTIDVYYVIFAEDFVSAVAWNREFVDLDVIGTVRDTAPYATFVEERAEGWRLGIGECKIGFNGAPIPLMKETIFYNDDYQGGTGLVRVLPNVLEDPTYPIYSDCQTILHPCMAGELLIETVVPTDSQSWGSVKALY